jgi:hypothetical protein
VKISSLDKNIIIARIIQVHQINQETPDDQCGTVVKICSPKQLCTHLSICKGCVVGVVDNTKMIYNSLWFGIQTFQVREKGANIGWP